MSMGGARAAKRAGGVELGKPTRDGYEPEQLHGYERSELHSLRQHLDTDVVGRMMALEKVATYAAAYLAAAGLAGLGQIPVSHVQEAHNALVVALDEAGFAIHV